MITAIIKYRKRIGPALKLVNVELKVTFDETTFNGGGLPRNDDERRALAVSWSMVNPCMVHRVELV